MSLSKDQANTAASTANDAQQAALDTNFIVQADLVIASQIAQGLYVATLTLTKGVSAINVMKYYQNLGYKVLMPSISGYGYSGTDVYGLNGIGNDYQSDGSNLDQPVDLYGFFYDQFYNSAPINLAICDGKIPSYLYLSWS